MADISHYNNALYATFSPFLLRCCLLWFIRVVESAVSQVAICSRQVAASVCVFAWQIWLRVKWEAAFKNRREASGALAGMIMENILNAGEHFLF